MRMSSSANEDRQRWERWLPFLWLALSAFWAAVIFVTNAPAWPLALWIAATLGPLTVLQRRAKEETGSEAPPRR